MPDPVVLNDMAGLAILEGRHALAARLLMDASLLVKTVAAKRVLVERAREEAKIAWFEDLITLAPKCPWPVE